MFVVNSEALNEFLNNELKSRCNADPKSLTRYVKALLKKKRKESELRHCLLDALDVFLGKETIAFVDLLLEALKSESYASLGKPESPVEEVEADNFNAETGLVKIKPGVGNETKNEQTLEREDLGRHTKNRKPVKRDRSPTGNFAAQGSSNLSIAPPPMLSHERCKDYDLVGYCMAGSSCSFYHGTDALVVEDMHDIFPQNKNTVILPHDIIPPPPLPTQSFPLPPLPPPPPEPPHPPLSVYPLTHPVPEAYNPEHPGIEPPHTQHTLSNSYPFNTRKRELVVLPTNSLTMNKERHVKRKAYFDYNRLGPKPPKCVKTDPNDTKLELRNVPPKLNNIVTINSYFAKFGTITNIEIGPTSIIRFEKPSQAESAFKNAPKCSFDLYYDGKTRESENTLSTYGKKKESKKFIFDKNDTQTFNKSNSTNKQALSNKKLELLKKKQFLLQARIEYYKVLVEKIARVRARADSSHTRNNKTEMQFLLETMETVSNQILKMKTEIKNESLALKKSLDPSHSLTGKKPIYIGERESEKALLDAEMDFYHSKSLLRPCKNEISEESNKNLLFEVNELKEKAKWLGLYEKDPFSLNINTPEPNSNEILERNSLSVCEEINLDTTNSLSIPQQEQESTEQSSDISKTNSLLLGDDEEEDEEDSEARSWRR